jgi:hypothetical protein
MAGTVQLELGGETRDVNPEYSYFHEIYKKHTNFSIFSREVKLLNEPDFGETIKFTIPQNCGHFLTKISLKMVLPGISTGNRCYIESVAHAIIEHARIFIGDQLIQEVPSDYLQIYSEHNISLTHQHSLEEKIGKYPFRLNTKQVSDPVILSHNNLGKDGKNEEFIVDVPFYFYNHPELALPISSINKQLIEVEFKLSNFDKLVTDINAQYPLTDTSHTGDLEMSMVTELVLTNMSQCLNKKYIITQIQQNIFKIDENEGNFMMTFSHPVKELCFVIQRDNVSPYDYDNSLNFVDDTYILYENLKSLELILDDQVILTGKLGSVQFLKAVQSRIHHTRCQIIRRFYSYSFGLKPEEWYPNGQINFSNIKNQIIKVKLHRGVPSVPRKLKVYALSYNILDVKDGFAHLMY